MLQFSDDAIADLTNIRETIAQDSPARALEKIEDIIKTCKYLETHPGLGRVHRGNIRRFSKRPWLIIYAPSAGGIWIYRVFDSRQDWAARLQITPV